MFYSQIKMFKILKSQLYFAVFTMTSGLKLAAVENTGW